MQRLEIAEVIRDEDEDVESAVNKAENLLLSNGNGKWTTRKGSKAKRLKAEFRLRSASNLHRLDLGNFYSAHIKISARNGNENPVEIASRELMTRSQVVSGNGNSGEVMIFVDVPKELKSRVFDRVSVLCLQPHQKEIFGLSALVFHGQRLQAEAEPEKPKEIHLELAQKSTSKDGVRALIDSACRQKRLGTPTSTPMSDFAFRKEIRAFLTAKDASRSKSVVQLHKEWHMYHSDRRHTEAMKTALEDVIRTFVKESASLTTSLKRPSSSLRSIENVDDEYALTDGRRGLALFDTSASQKRPKLDFDPSRLLKMSDAELSVNGFTRFACRAPKTIRHELTTGGGVQVLEKSSAVYFFRRGSESTFLYYDRDFFRINLTPSELKRLHSASTSGFCPLCQEEFSMEDLEQHAATCEGKAPSPSTSRVECPLCSQKFEVEDIQRHSAQCGEDDVQVEEPGRPKCPICNRNDFDEDLENHAQRCAQNAFGA